MFEGIDDSKHTSNNENTVLRQILVKGLSIKYPINILQNCQGRYRQGKSKKEKLSQFRGTQEDMTTKCNVVPRMGH